MRGKGLIINTKGYATLPRKEVKKRMAYDIAGAINKNLTSSANQINKIVIHSLLNGEK